LHIKNKIYKKPAMSDSPIISQNEETGKKGSPVLFLPVPLRLLFSVISDRRKK
jgi:hypothetical protein